MAFYSCKQIEAEAADKTVQACSIAKETRQYCQADLLGELQPLMLNLLAVILEEAVQLSHGALDLLICIAEAVLHLQRGQ